LACLFNGFFDDLVRSIACIGEYEFDRVVAVVQPVEAWWLGRCQFRQFGGERCWLRSGPVR
jgi:hypothetical protein